MLGFWLDPSYLRQLLKKSQDWSHCDRIFMIDMIDSDFYDPVNTVDLVVK